MFTTVVYIILFYKGKYSFLEVFIIDVILLNILFTYNIYSTVIFAELINWFNDIRINILLQISLFTFSLKKIVYLFITLFLSYRDIRPNILIKKKIFNKAKKQMQLVKKISKKYI